MHVRLVVVEPEAETNQYRLELPIMIGRAAEASIQLEHALISRRHCELIEHKGRVVVRDLGSRNGTFVAGKRIESQVLPSGELLTVGGYTFRAIYRDPVWPPGRGKLVEETAQAGSTMSCIETSEAPTDYMSEQVLPPPGSDDDPDEFLKRV